MVQDHDDREGYLQFPVLVSDEDGAADECEEMHFEQPMHLVDVLGHKDGHDQAQHILIHVAFWQKELYRVIGQQT